MNLGILTKVKTDNAEEHLKVVLKDVEIASSQLTKILVKISTAKIDLETIENKIIEQNIKSGIISKECSDKLRKIEVEKEDLSKLSNDLEIKKENIDKEIEKRKNDLELLSSRFATSLIYHKDTYEKFEKDIKFLDESITKLEQLDSTLRKKTSNSTKELQKITNEIEKKKEEKELLEIELNRFVISSKKEREIIQGEIDKQKETIANPMKLLGASMNEVQTKERDVNVLIKRFRIEFKKLYPDKIMPI